MSCLFMMIGLPGSGKSTVAANLKDYVSFDVSNAEVFSSDAIRKELYGAEATQGNSNEVFNLLYERASDSISNGHDVVIDATNINHKNRINTITTFKKKFPSLRFAAFVIATPIDVCLEWNKGRDRVVPSSVIYRMQENFTIPSYAEGWDLIKLIYLYDTFKEFYIPALDWIDNVMDYDQHNVYHTSTLGEHCFAVGSLMPPWDNVLVQAGYLHDFGKPSVQTPYNKKGEWSDSWHYYSHENVGSYNSLFVTSDLNMEERLECANLIRWHMLPYNFGKKEKYYKDYFGETFFNRLMRLHKADEISH